MSSILSEKTETLEILKINHDEEMGKIFKKYPLEDGYDIKVISCTSINARTELITISIMKLNKDNKEVKSLK